MPLIELIMDALIDEDKHIVSFLDGKKTDDEIINAMISANLLNYEQTIYENQENK